MILMKQYDDLWICVLFVISRAESMTSVMDHRRSVPVYTSTADTAPGSQEAMSDFGSGSHSGSYPESLDDSIPDYLDLNIVLPTGDIKRINVESR